jgi:hypothetical protein
MACRFRDPAFVDMADTTRLRPKEDDPLRYLLLIYADEATADDSPETMQNWFKYTEELQKSGVMQGGEALQPVATATTIRAANGDAVTLDGPFAETKEQLGGFYLVDCKDLDEAIAWAAKMPVLPRGSVEVRPVMEFE